MADGIKTFPIVMTTAEHKRLKSMACKVDIPMRRFVLNALDAEYARLEKKERDGECACGGECDGECACGGVEAK